MTAFATPLAGRRVLLTRSADDCADWARRLEQRGAAAVLLPCIDAESIDTPELRSAAALALAAADWLVFTSRRGVAALAALVSSGPDARRFALPAACRVAAVGEATAAAAREATGRVSLVGRGTAADLGELLAAEGELGARPNVLLALAANAGDALERALGAAGARCTRLEVYRTVPAAAVAPKQALSSLDAGDVLLASPSAVKGFVQQVSIDAPVNIYTIGPSTTAAARAQGLAVTAEAREPSLDGMLEAMQWPN